MQRLLNPIEVDLIDARLHDNALLAVCRRIWPERQEEITSVMAVAEDIFYETAWLIDELIEIDADTDVMSLTRGLWSTVFNDIGYWANGVSKNDRYLIASTIFRLVATAFSLHWHSYYCDTLRDSLLAMVDERRPSPETIHEYQLLERQQEELLDSVITNSTILKDWVIDYIDDSESLLTEEIDLALNPHLNTNTRKPESRKDDKNNNIIIKRERTVWNGKEITHSFEYRPNGISNEERNNRLSTFFNLLNKKYVSHTDMNTFINIFSGVATTEYVVWKRTIVELQYMVEQLIGKQLITWSHPAPGKWQIVCARFMHEHKSKEGDQYGLVIDSLKPDQFNKIPKKSKLKENPLLDKIISILIPNSDAQRISNEILEIFAKAEIAEDENISQSQVKEVDY